MVMSNNFAASQLPPIIRLMVVNVSEEDSQQCLQRGLSSVQAVTDQSRSKLI